MIGKTNRKPLKLPFPLRQEEGWKAVPWEKWQRLEPSTEIERTLTVSLFNSSVSLLINTRASRRVTNTYCELTACWLPSQLQCRMCYLYRATRAPLLRYLSSLNPHQEGEPAARSPLDLTPVHGRGLVLEFLNSSPLFTVQYLITGTFPQASRWSTRSMRQCSVWGARRG